MLDANLVEFNLLINSSRLGSSEKDLLRNMMAQLRDLEKVTNNDTSTLVTSEEQLAPFCARMKQADYQNVGQPPEVHKIADRASLFFDITTLAFVLDLTDAASMSFNSPGASFLGYEGLPYVFNGQNKVTDAGMEPHQLSHDCASVDGSASAEELSLKRTISTALDRFHAGQVANFADKLKSFSLGAGTLLDETVIYWSSETSWAPDNFGHQCQNIPIMMVGGKGLDNMPVGKLLTYAGLPTNAGFFAALAKRFGVPETSVSTDRYRRPAIF